MAQVVVMGVTGCGKTTVGAKLADALGVPFRDGDDFHPPASVAKMAAGVPLSDDDRWPWLAEVGAWLAGRPEGGIIACSALKRAYRDAIRAAAPGAVFLHLAASHEVLAARVDARQAADGHFMASSMLASQFADLEPLEGDERGTEVDVAERTPALAAAQAKEWVDQGADAGWEAGLDDWLGLDEGR